MRVWMPVSFGGGGVTQVWMPVSVGGRWCNASEDASFI